MSVTVRAVTPETAETAPTAARFGDGDAPRRTLIMQTEASMLDDDLLPQVRIEEVSR